jgi:triacylglycerol esterase/lipase EstA (alpha/beta hydrolase family)
MSNVAVVARDESGLPEHPEPGVVDALALAALYAEELVVGTTRDTHRAIANRVFGLANRGTKQAARVPQAVHDTVAGSIYASISLAFTVAATGLAKVGASGVGPRLNDSPQGRVLHSAVNGLIGEKLRDEHPHLALSMTVRVGGQPVRLDRAGVAEAFPRATERLVVFIHGLGEHEDHWNVRRYEMGGSYGTRLEAAGGWTPVYLRVNTGLSVAENGVALTALMQQLVDAWPVPVRRIGMVGHSMGGLIIRAGCAVATEADQPWTERVSDVITLGTPHLGADLALGVSHGSRLMALAPEIAAFGRILEHRSPGIRDLERGLPELPPMPHARYRLVSAALGSERSILGRLLGDILVRQSSACATRRALRLFPDADLLHVPNADHFSLLNHPEVFRAIKDWLA